jgi:hypothetical protein
MIMLTKKHPAAIKLQDEQNLNQAMFKSPKAVRGKPRIELGFG